MYELNEILENKLINNLSAGFDRSPAQLNKPHESDAEIIRIEKMNLAVTTDSISEEIFTGLYDDPYLMGWMIVTVNMSDLAAVGASPLGILISEIIPRDFSIEKLQQLQRGISDACRRYKTYVLGGDTNEGESLVLTGTAIGKTACKKHLTRIGCRSGDILFSSGKLGNGNAYAISKLITASGPFPYKPDARIEAGRVIRNYASACMDSSDGLIASLDQLMRLNDVGFELNPGWENAISRNALSYISNLKIPPWLLLAGQHGEFELIFTIPEKLIDAFLIDAPSGGFEPVELGRVTDETGLNIHIYEKNTQIDTKFIRNLPSQIKGDVKLYLNKLIEYDFQLKNQPSRIFTNH